MRSQTPAPEDIDGNKAAASGLPLVVDLDGTLIRSDVSIETAIGLVRGNLLELFLLPCRLLEGRAALKRRLARMHPVDPALLPYNTELLEYLREERGRGRKIVLATASDSEIAERVASHLGIFDEVIGSDGIRNLKGAAKADVLVGRYGEGGFTYAGNSGSDLAVWSRARSAVVVNAGASVARAAAGVVQVDREFRNGKRAIPELVREIRPHQWLKNFLVFLAPLAGHALFQPQVLRNTFMTFAAFCAASSGIYVINDLFDLESDRKHPRKRFRPFASGDLPLVYGFAGPALLLVAMGLSLALSPEVMLIVYLYATVSLSYSKYFKTRPLVDVFCLAFLYTIRMYAGGITSNIPVSIWLLNFSGFLFLSLGFLKRYVEFPWHPETENPPEPGRRGYRKEDSLFLLIMGVASSFIATVVFALYVDSTEGHKAFKTYYLLWGIVPLVLFWQLRLWLATVRGFMHDDPVVYAAKDNISRMVIALALLFYILASTDFHAYMVDLLD